MGVTLLWQGLHFAGALGLVGFRICGSQVLEHKLSSCGPQRISCSQAYGIFPGRGWNGCLLHWGGILYPWANQASPALILSADHEGESVSCLSPYFQWLTSNLWCSLTCRSISPVSAFIFIMVFLLSVFVCVCVSVQISPFSKDTSYIGLGAHPHGGFPGGSNSKESACNAGVESDGGSIPGSGRCPGAGNGSPLQYSCLENPMNRGIWWTTVCGVAKIWTRLRD